MVKTNNNEAPVYPRGSRTHRDSETSNEEVDDPQVPLVAGITQESPEPVVQATVVTPPPPLIDVTATSSSSSSSPSLLDRVLLPPFFSDSYIRSGSLYQQLLSQGAAEQVAFDRQKVYLILRLAAALVNTGDSDEEQ